MPTADASHHVIPPRIRAHTQRAAAMFAERFGRAPTRAAVAPGRVNLIGEHTDYNMGFVLPIAIERETVIVADRAANPQMSTLVATDLGETVHVDLSQPLRPQGNKHGNYLLGVAAQLHERGCSLPNLDVLITSTVPIGAGLSSSAAVEVAFALLLLNVVGMSMPPPEVARLCRKAEHAFPGTPCGIMDMLISAAARPDHAMLLDCRSEEARHVQARFAAMEATLFVIDTGVRRELAASAYAERRATCEAVACALNLPSLRSATIESLNIHGLTTDQRRRALHVIAENTRTVLAAEALVLNDLHRFGDLMYQSHASLRDLFDVSCSELDALVDAANAMRDRDAGVFGARMTGGGFGGCAIVLCKTTALTDVIESLREIFVARFDREPGPMFTTAAAGGARPLPASLI